MSLHAAYESLDPLKSRGWPLYALQALKQLKCVNILCLAEVWYVMYPILSSSPMLYCVISNFTCTHKQLV
jgi:hypothetical protein